MVAGLDLEVDYRRWDMEVWDSVVAVADHTNKADNSPWLDRSADTCPAAVNQYVLELDQLNGHLKGFQRQQQRDVLLVKQVGHQFLRMH